MLLLPLLCLHGIRMPGGPKKQPTDPSIHHRRGRFTNLPELKKRRKVGT